MFMGMKSQPARVLICVQLCIRSGVHMSIWFLYAMVSTAPPYVHKVAPLIPNGNVRTVQLLLLTRERSLYSVQRDIVYLGTLSILL